VVNDKNAIKNPINCKNVNFYLDSGGTKAVGFLHHHRIFFAAGFSGKPAFVFCVF
jgi:hypothetical protein